MLSSCFRTDRDILMFCFGMAHAARIIDTIAPEAARVIRRDLAMSILVNVDGGCGSGGAAAKDGDPPIPGGAAMDAMGRALAECL